MAALSVFRERIPSQLHVRSFFKGLHPFRNGKCGFYGDTELRHDPHQDGVTL